MRLAVVILAAAVLAGAGSARADETVVLPPVDDVSLPFLCSWGYDWEERCYRDRLDRLELGGASDKIWRSALRFSLEAIPPTAAILGAELWLRYDGTCAAPRRRTVPCEVGPFGIEARPIFTDNWYGRREVAFGPAMAFTEVEAASAPRWVVWDLTDLVSQWHSGDSPNDGVLLKVVDEQESYDVGGPAMPSSRYADAELRPRLVVMFVS